MKKTSTWLTGLAMGLLSVAATTELFAEAPVILTKYTQSGNKTLGFDAQPNGKPLQIADKTYKKGLSTGFAIMEFELNVECKSFHADIGLTKGAKQNGHFFVLLDDAIFIRHAQPAAQQATGIDLPCPGVSQITLVSEVKDGGNNRGIWADARVVTAKGETIYLSDVLKKQEKLNWSLLERRLGRVDPEPETKTLSEAKGNKVIERDWLMQAEGESLGKRALAEIAWTRKLAKRVLAKNDSGKERKKTKAKIDIELAKLAKIEEHLGKDVDLGGSTDCAALTEILGTSIYGDGSLSIPVKNGIYKIQFLLYEGWGANGRRMDIAIEGKPVVKDYFCWEKQGSSSSHGSLVSTAVKITDGQIDISLNSKIGGPHLPGLIISKVKAVAPVTESVLDNPSKLDLTDVVKTINFGTTKNQTVAGTTFLAAGANSTVDGVKNTVANEIGVRGNAQSVPQIGPETKNCDALTEILGTSIYGNGSLSIPVKNGIYKIQFLLYEGWGATAPTYTNGRRINIAIENKSVVKDYFCWKKQGSTGNHGSLVSTAVKITDGQINISLNSLIGRPHLSGLIISKAKAVAPVIDSVLDNPSKLDLTDVVKTINFGTTKNQTVAGTTFLAAGANSTVDGVKNRVANEIGVRGKGQSVPRIGPKTKQFFAHLDEYIAVRQIKRTIMMMHPAIDFSKIVMVDNPYPSGNAWIHESRSRAGFMGTPGGRLLVLDGLKPSGKISKLAPGDKAASFHRPAVSYDGKKILFTMSTVAKKSADKIYNLYEINVDGTGLRQLTSGKYNDIDPVYLPDGNIAFLTDRANTYGGCAPWAPQYTMARCDKNGENIYLLSVGSEGEFSPSMLNDGRLVYTRWEYNDKALNRAQSLWTMNVDGTMSSTYWGNQSFFPDHIGEARSIPGSSKVVFNGMGHHDLYSGSIGVIDSREGMDAPDGLYKVTRDVPWAEGGDGPEGVQPKPYCDDYHSSGKLKHAQYKSPYPLSEDLFLVSARTIYHNGSAPASNQPSLFKLYLMDKYGNHELIYSGSYNILHAQPLKARTLPAIKPSTVQWPGKEKDDKAVATGMLYCADVYEGTPKEMHGKAKFLRVIEAVQRTYTTGCLDGGGSPFGSKKNEALDYFPVGGNPQRKEVDTWWGDGAILAGPAIAINSNTRIKRVLGTVPIAKDGSFYFNAPPGKSIYFQLLDEKKRVIQSMRSWVNLMPGERRGCVGCHEGRMNAPAKPFKFSVQPDEIKPPSWGVKTLSYVQDIQPIFEKNCAKCHMGDGKARKKLDLTLRPDKHNRWGGIFPEPYITLTCGINSVCNHGAYIDGIRCVNRYPAINPAKPTIAGNFNIWTTPYTTLPPMTYWSYKSPLINMLMDGHNKVKLTEEEMGKLMAWIDTNCHYRSLKDVVAIDDPDSDWFLFWPNPPKLKSAPYINHVYKQDEFNSQADRLALVETLPELKKD